MKNAERDNPPKRILIVASTGAGIGDILMGTPALRALRKSFPRSRIDVLVHAQRKELFRDNPHLDRVLGYRNNWLHRGWLGLRKLPFRYDWVLVFHANDDIWKILRFLRYRECHNRQGYIDAERRVFSLHPLPRHSVQKRMGLVAKVGGKTSEDYRYDYKIPPEAISWAKGKLQEWGVADGDRLIGLQLGAADRYKCWPVESFVEVAHRLEKQFRVRIYLNAAPSENELLQRFQDLWKGEPVLAASAPTLSRSAALLQSCALFITNDTGPMHMAIGLKVPLLALFCPSQWDVTGPLGYDRGIIIRKERPCQPCLYRKCPDPFCMRQISVEEIYQATERMLTGGSAS